jgi:ketosteroid isomerase-like protein
MSFPELLEKFARAVEAGDGAALGALFTEDGVYDDVFYGEFRGRAAIAEMLAIFHRDGEAFRWDFRDPVSDGATGYAGWLFSYTATTKHAAGTRVVFDGVGRFRLRDGLIERYADYCNGVVPLRQMGTPWDVVDRMTGRWQAHLEADPAFGSHSEG